jgi:hypothetical protein
MKRQIITIGLAIVALLLVLLPRIGYSQPPVSSGGDSPCFYRQADGTIVDLRSICGERSPSTPLPGRIVPSGNGVIPPSPSTPANPAMKITPPNDPGVLYLSGSGSADKAAGAASQAEKQPR